MRIAEAGKTAAADNEKVAEEGEMKRRETAGQWGARKSLVGREGTEKKKSHEATKEQTWGGAEDAGQIKGMSLTNPRRQNAY